ncbi:hypothetical protein MSG28_006566 [Choristoneura fumiferana]|uniref:Uncharacterized protein n=1 Tax=Choristoneura fumiferana TaxID=7141 RepID=A0ACC0JFI0_CHOFU|nr:hypothetical protein MSG28_006566 [Choristoneura fumiferana]
MGDDHLENCYFVPLSTLQKVKNFVSEPLDTKSNCSRNLYQLQLQRTKEKPLREPLTFHTVISSAIYSHDWNKLLYLLKKYPVSEMRHPKLSNDMDIYIRAYTILLMHHPFAKANCLLDDYLHMVLGCRSQEDKKAVIKVLVTLTDKLYDRTARARTVDVTDDE